MQQSALDAPGPLARAGLLLLAASLSPLAAAAQEPLPQAPTVALLQGVVVDEATHQPVASATVSLVGTPSETLTGRWGIFSFPDAAPGTVSVRVTAPGHPSIVQDVEVRSDRVAFVQVLLPRWQPYCRGSW